MLKELLSNSKLDFETYANLPVYEDVLVMEPNDSDRPLLKQWEKLNHLRENLQILDQYINSNKGEKLKDSPISGKLSKAVLSKIGKYNNETGGISAYFLDLQNFYDEQEDAYDKMEAKARLTPDMETLIPELRLKREEKRDNRRATRKIAFKELKADDKGYLNVVIEDYEPEPEPTESEKEVMFNADGSQTAQVVKKATGGIGKAILWTSFVALAIGVGYSMTKKDE